MYKSSYYPNHQTIQSVAKMINISSLYITFDKYKGPGCRVLRGLQVIWIIQNYANTLWDFILYFLQLKWREVKMFFFEKLK